MEASFLADQQRVWVCGCWALGVGHWVLDVHSRFQFSPFLLSLSAVIQGTDLPFLC
jgi:hypothetical protein